MIEQELKAIREMAEAKARELKIDQAVRTICKLKAQATALTTMRSGLI